MIIIIFVFATYHYPALFLSFFNGFDFDCFFINVGFMLILKPFQKERARAGGGKRGGWLPNKVLGAKRKSREEWDRRLYRNQMNH